MNVRPEQLRLYAVTDRAWAADEDALMDQIARRDTAAALDTLARLYAGGKDVASVLGELSALARDLLLRKTAPQGGAGLLPGPDHLQVGDPPAPQLLAHHPRQRAALGFADVRDGKGRWVQLVARAHSADNSNL